MVAKINADTSGGLTITSDTSGTLEIQSAGTTKFTVNNAGVDIPAIGTIDGLTSINGGQVGGRRNIVINGAMKVAQRSASVAGLGAASGFFTLDRWKMLIGSASAGRYTMAQVADGPAGFANCLKITTTTADTSIAVGERLTLIQAIEGQDLQQLKKGTASAEQFTVSFWVKGNANALYVCEIYDNDSATNITQSFAVTTSWNRIELTFAADTSNPLDDDNAASLTLFIWLHGGSTYTGGTFASNTWATATTNNRYAVADRTSIFDATSRTFFITGVQMEIGSTATDFEHRSFGEELTLCQRYYFTVPRTYGIASSATAMFTSVAFPVEMRATPTLITILATPSGESPRLVSGRTSTAISPTLALTDTKQAGIKFNGFSSMTAQQSALINTCVGLTAEL